MAEKNQLHQNFLNSWTRLHKYEEAVLGTGSQAHGWEQWVSTFTPAIQHLVLCASQPATIHQTAQRNTDPENVIGSVLSLCPAII